MLELIQIEKYIFFKHILYDFRGKHVTYNASTLTELSHLKLLSEGQKYRQN